MSRESRNARDRGRFARDRRTTSIRSRVPASGLIKRRPRPDKASRSGTGQRVGVDHDVQDPGPGEVGPGSARRRVRRRCCRQRSNSAASPRSLRVRRREAGRRARGESADPAGTAVRRTGARARARRSVPARAEDPSRMPDGSSSDIARQWRRRQRQPSSTASAAGSRST